jgi:threonyl-tRNA synthetase
MYKEDLKMTAKESEKIVKEMKAFTKKVTASKEKARKFLVSVGTHTPKGNLTKAYR